MDSARRILLVEDDPIIRLGVSAVLVDAGYEVLEAADAEEAMAILESETGIRLMISDIQMPGSLDGVKLARAVRRRWPPVAILLTSGRHTPGADELSERVHYLAKPFAPPELLAEVGRLAGAQ